MTRILVIGDAISDIYRECIFKKMCPEDPRAPAVVESSRECIPGGAANVAVNLAALSPNSMVDLIGVLDEELGRSIKFLSRNRVNCYYSILDRPLIKERIICGGEISVRIDNSREVTHYAAERIQTRLLEYLAEHDPDLILLSDYAGQTVNDVSLEALLRRREKLVVDTKMTDLSIFGGGSRTLACKLNVDERNGVLLGDHAPERHFNFFVLTRGSGGASVIVHRDSKEGSVTHTLDFKGYDVPVVDVNGCGDTFLAGFAAGIFRTNDPVAAAEFANAAAATVVSKRRTAVADLERALGMLRVGNEVGTGIACADHRDPAPRVDRGL